MAKLKGGTRIYGDIKIDGGIRDSNNAIGIGGSVLISTGVGIAWTTSSSGGGGATNWQVKTANYTAVSGDRIVANTAGGSWTLTLPAAPATGDSVQVADAASWAVNSLTVARNGSTIEGSAEDLILDVVGVKVDFIYDGATWEVYTSIGPQGIQGLQGLQGLQGRQGTQGVQGVQGVQGLQGLQGLQGRQGTQGVQGVQGVQGLQGLQGLQGRQGTQGVQGTQGLQGAQGLQGLQGLQGRQGTQGVQGVQGVQGTQGAQGLANQGVQGSQGLQGLQGLQGRQGAQGLANQGVQGSQGSQGAQGTQGAQGLANQGVQGSQGLQGLQGLQGRQGAQGLSNQGVQGLQGLQGLQGRQGAQGVQGVQGLQGLQGRQGAQGVQGPQGLQGLQGTAAPATTPSTITRTAFTATAGQTTFSVTYSPNYIQVFLNGSHLAASEYTATNGTSVVLASGASASDILEVVAYNLGNFVSGVQGNQGVQGLQGTQGRQGTQGLSNQGVQGSIGIQGLVGSTSVSVSDDTTTNATRYILFDDITTGTLGTVNVSSTKLTYNPSTGNLVVGGTVTASSDQAIKTNVKTIENALEKVLSLRGVEYDRIDTKARQIGVIAQEIEKIIPEVVLDGEVKSVAYGNLTAILIEAIKELNQKVDSLTK